MNKSVPKFVIVCSLFLFLFPVYTIAQSSGIRSVDFRNFSYRPSCLEMGDLAVPKPPPIRTSNGSWSKGDPNDPNSDKVTFNVKSVVYGDLTGKGENEAVVISSCNTGGTLTILEGYLFTMRKGKPAFVLTVDGGDRAQGGVYKVRIENRVLRVERLGTYGGANIPDYVETTSYRLMGSDLIKTGIGGISDLSDGPKSIRFETGRSGATIRGNTGQHSEYILAAQAGQILSLKLKSNDPNAGVTVTDKDRATIGSEKPVITWMGKLPPSGVYRINVSSTGATSEFTLEVEVR